MNPDASARLVLTAFKLIVDTIRLEDDVRVDLATATDRKLEQLASGLITLILHGSETEITPAIGSLSIVAWEAVSRRLAALESSK